MSEASDNAIVRFQIADYAAVDAGGKINIVGGGLGVIGLAQAGPHLGASGMTVPFAVVVSVAVPPALYGTVSSIELFLEDGAGNVVSTPLAPGQPPQPVRIGQNVTFDAPSLPAALVPRDTLQARYQWVLSFNTGLPLIASQRYVWRLKIDTVSQPEWTEEFYVPGPIPGPVIG